MITVLAVLAVLAAAFLLFVFVAGERGGFHRSTWRYFREAGFGLSALHGYVYGRWTQRYVNFLLNSPPPRSQERAEKMARWLADHYHGKVLTHEHARAIVTLDRKIPLQDLDQIVPYPVARTLVLDGPPDVVVFECPCRHARASHCEPTQVCMVIGQPMADFMLDHHPGITRRLSPQEAVQLLEAEHQRGHVHSAWFKDAMMDRFYSICNCCKCCCGGVNTMRQGTRMMASSGYVAEIDSALCGLCGDCVAACPFDALSDGDSGISRDWDRCMGCGVCEVKCATGAVSLVRDERKGIPLDVRVLRDGRSIPHPA